MSSFSTTSKQGPWARISLTMLALMACWVSGAQAQPSWGLKVNPLSIFLLTANVQVEHPLSEKFSLQLGAFAGSTDFQADTTLSAGTVHYTCLGLTPELRYFPRFAKKPAPEGFYLAAYFRFRYVSRSWVGPAYSPALDSNMMANNRQQIPAAGMGGLIGYQFLFGGKLALDIYTGPQFLVSSPKFEATCSTCVGDERPAGRIGPDFMGMEMRAGLSVGYFF